MNDWPFPQPQEEQRRRVLLWGAFSALALIFLLPLAVLMLGAFGILLWAIGDSMGVAGWLIDAWMVAGVAFMLWVSFKV